ncbi:alpha/beta-hydrolase [Neoconidiobolus thromboides FSU 785]|nr:alpha/beta-hydrolase [Neoconidiobolus thromboides FSU 785]
MLKNNNSNNNNSNNNNSNNNNSIVEEKQFKILEEEYESNLLKAFNKEGKCYLDDKNYLSYRIYGNGKNKLLFIMGLNATGSHWGYQAKYFGNLEDYQVCTFDNRGIGTSSCPPGPYTTSLLANDALALLNHLEWNDNVNLIGVSMGGMIAQLMALKQTQRFNSVTFTSTYNSAALVVPTTEDIQIFFKMLSRTRTKMMRPLIKVCFPKPWLKEEILPGLSNFQFLLSTLKKFDFDNSERYSMGEYWQAIAALLHNIPPYRLKQIKKSGIKTLVLHGTKDKIIRPTYGTLLSSILSCPLIQFKNSGHMLMIERGIEYNLILRAHIEGKELNHYLQLENREIDNKNLILVNGVENKKLEEESNKLCNEHKPEKSWLNKLFHFKKNNDSIELLNNNDHSDFHEDTDNDNVLDDNNKSPNLKIEKSLSSPIPENGPFTILNRRSKSFFSANNFNEFLQNYLSTKQH